MRKVVFRIIVLTICVFIFTPVMSMANTDTELKSMTPYSITATVYVSEKGEYGISWHTKSRMTEPVIQLINEKDNFDESAAAFFAATVSEYDGYHTYKGVVTAPEPSARYYYRVGDKATGVFSEYRSFVTSSLEKDSFTFLHMTDTQGGYRNWRTVLTAAMLLYDAPLLVHTGDLVDIGNKESDWKAAFKATEKQLGSMLLSSVAGSYHENNGTELFENFNFYIANDQDVNHGIYYSYDYNNVHFTMLDINDYSSKTGTFSDAQIEWLENDLKNTDKQWKIVGMHWGIYTAGPRYHNSENVNLRKNLDPIFDRYDVDLVLTGHDHVYTRTYPIKNGKVIEDVDTVTDKINGIDTVFDLNPQGTVYLLSNTAGHKYYDLSISEESIEFFAQWDQSYMPMFSAITVEGNKLMINAYLVDPDTGESELFDSYAIMKIAEKQSFFERYGTYIIISSACVLGVTTAVLVIFVVRKKRIKQI